MRATFTVCRVLGIPVRINISWFAALALSAGVLALRIYPTVLPAAPAASYWAFGFVTALVFFLSVLLHEFGHAVVARAYGLPVRNITLFMLGGVAQVGQEMKRPGVELLVAAAGPLVSVALAGAFWLAAELSGFDDRLALMWTWLSWMNVSVALFNLLPGFPMDGGRLLRAAIWKLGGSYRIATRAAAWCGRVIAVGMMLFGVSVVLHLRFVPAGIESVSGIWLVLIGVYLDSMSRRSLSGVRVLEQLRRIPAREFMQHNVPIVPQNATVGEFLPELLASNTCEAVFVASDAGDQAQTMVGLVTRGSAVTVPERDRARTTAGELMQATDGMRPAAPEDDAASLLQRLEHEGLAVLPVVAADEVLGLVGRVGLARLIERRAVH